MLNNKFTELTHIKHHLEYIIYILLILNIHLKKIVSQSLS